MASLEQRPTQRMSITDLTTLEEVEMQFNPSELTETVRIDWARLRIPGLSHERLQFNHTENYKATFRLIFDALTENSSGISIRRGNDAARNLDTRNFLMSLCYPKQGAATVSDGEAPRVLLVWPNLISLTAKIDELKFHHSRFALDGTPTFFEVDITLEEIRDTRLTSEDVRASGTQRSSSTTPTDTNGSV